VSQFALRTTVPASEKPFLIDRFGGVDTETSDSDYSVRAQTMKNFRLLPDGTLAKRCGYEKYSTLPADIRGMWYGAVGGVTALWCAAGNGFYKCIAGAPPILTGTLATSSGEVGIFFFKGRLYILDGGENVTGGDYYSFDGMTFGAVTGYIPLIYNATGSTAYGTAYEDFNILTNTVRKHTECTSFNDQYQCNYTIGSVISVVLHTGRGIDAPSSVIDPSRYTISGQFVVFDGNPTLPTGYSVTITYTIIKPELADMKKLLTSCRGFAQYGVNDNSHSFLFCGSDKNLVFPSECENGTDYSAEYFPLTSPFRVGSENMAVTAAIRQYDKLMIFTEGETWSALQIESVNTGGATRHTYSLEMLNDMYGACIRGGVRQYENVFYSLMPSGVYSWDTTDIEGERKAHRISDKIAGSLGADFLTDGITHCSQKLGEFWIAYGGGIWIYDIAHKQWYYFDDIPADAFITADGGAEAFAHGNIIYIFSDTLFTDDGSLYSAVYKSNPFDLGISYRKKTLHGISLTVDTPQNGSISLSLSADGRAAHNLNIINSADGLKSGITLRCRITRLRLLTAQFTSRSGGRCEIRGAALSFSVGAQR